MSTWKETAIALGAYYLIVFGGREMMRNREAFQFPTIFKIHNLFLTLVSGCLLALFTEQLLSTVVNKGIFYAICDADGGWTNRLVTLYYVRNGYSVAETALICPSLIIVLNTLSFWILCSWSSRKSH